MRAEEAREIADQVQKSGVKDILEKIKVQALKGETGLSISDYSAMNEQCRKVLAEMGYSVKFQDTCRWYSTQSYTQRDDGYWQINW